MRGFNKYGKKKIGRQVGCVGFFRFWKCDENEGNRDKNIEYGYVEIVIEAIDWSLVKKDFDLRSC